MRFIPGIAAAIVVAFAIAWTISHRDGADDPRPPDSFLDAEVTRGDLDGTGSCYALRVVLTQGQFWLANATSRWTERAPEEWSFRVEWLDSSSITAGSQWQEFDFALRDGLVEPVAARRSAADGVTAAGDVEAAFREWIEAAIDRRAGKVERCAG